MQQRHSPINQWAVQALGVGLEVKAVELRAKPLSQSQKEMTETRDGYPMSQGRRFSMALIWLQFILSLVFLRSFPCDPDAAVLSRYGAPDDLDLGDCSFLAYATHSEFFKRWEGLVLTRSVS
ncbi:hypothetical protein VNO77_02659 [Canavalia gladiata]|uniref:Uncharacterized protein n=1 Tax=Canavalia gladiata TaxID=3824 RepID=A0AAN9R6A8_CANGL